jgi:hypothetical protein
VCEELASGQQGLLLPKNHAPSGSMPIQLKFLDVSCSSTALTRPISIGNWPAEWVVLACLINAGERGCFVRRIGTCWLNHIRSIRPPGRFRRRGCELLP